MSHGHGGNDGGGDGHGHAHGDGGCCGGHDNDLEAPLLKEKGGCSHGHSHDHGHSHGGHGEKSDDDIKALQRAVWIALFFMFVELVGGYVANSLAIMTDAAHMLSDVGGFIISLLGIHIAQHGATEEFTYGFKQAEVLGAALSILIVWGLTAVLLYEAFYRFMHPEAIDAKVMFFISLIGLAVNFILMKVLGHNHSHSHGGEGCSAHGENVAVQAAIAHVIGDIVQSLGVCLAAVLIWWQPFDVGYTDTGISKWMYADPCCTVLFGIMVLYTTKGTVVFAMNNLMVRAPVGFNQALFMEKLQKIEHVDSVHDMHVWCMGSAEILCTAHVMINGGENQTFCLKQCIKVAQEVGIGHSTFQLEIVGEFDPSLESYGGVHANPLATKSGKSLGHGDGHDGHGDGHGHAEHGHSHGHDGGHDGGHDSGCCGGHGDGHEDGGHSHGGHEGGHDSGHGGHSHGDHAGGHDGGHDGGCCGGHGDGHEDGGHSHGGHEGGHDSGHGGHGH